MKSKLDKKAKFPPSKAKATSKEAAKTKSHSPEKPNPSKSSSASTKATKPPAAKSKAAAPKASASKASTAKVSKSSLPVKSSTAVKKSATDKSPASKTASAAKPLVGRAKTTTRPKAVKSNSITKSKTDSTETPFGLEEFTISLTKPGESKEKIWRTKNFQQFPAQKDFGFPDVAPSLPNQYNEPKLVLMPKDPEYMFCYWEITPTLLVEREKEKISNSNYRETLKINWEAKSLFEPNFTFIPVFFWAKKWYFGVPQVGQRYQVELGWLSDNGHFISILGSNLSELPESWANTQKRLADQGEVLAYSSKHTKTLGSSENLAVEDFRAFAPEWNLSSESMTSSSWSRGPSQDSNSIPEALKKSPRKGKGSTKSNKQAATPKARLEVSGKVIAGTKIRISGKPVSIDSAGNFRIEFPYDQDILSLLLTSKSGDSRAFTYDLKELVLN
jgi:Domain of unknown function (DUF4912)